MNCTLTVGKLYGCKLHLNETVKNEKSKIRFQSGFVMCFKKLLSPSAFNSLHFKISVL